MLASAQCSGKTFLTILVISSADNMEQRTTIRQTWGGPYTESLKHLKHIAPLKVGKGDVFIPPKNMVRVVFVVGRSVEKVVHDQVVKEHLQHRDIVFGDVYEDYRNLTLKTRCALKWMFFECRC